MKKKWTILVAVLLMTIVALAACSGGKAQTLSREDQAFVDKMLTPEQQEKAEALEKEFEKKLKEGHKESSPTQQVVFPADIKQPTEETEEKKEIEERVIEKILPPEVTIEYIEPSPIPDYWQVTYDAPKINEEVRQVTPNSPIIGEDRWTVAAYVELGYDAPTRWTGKTRSYKFCVEFNQGEGKLTSIDTIPRSQTGKLVKMSRSMAFKGVPERWKIVYPIEATYAKIWIEIEVD